MLPNIPPKLFTLSAVAVGYILLDDATAKEQNALGNWLMLVAQLLCTNAFYRQVREERGLEEKQKKSNKKQEKEETIEMLEKLQKAIKQELINLKKSENTSKKQKNSI